MFSKCQRRAFKKIENFLYSGDDSFLLQGGGGVGKTFMLQKLIKKYENEIFFISVAPTHKATSVLREKIGFHWNSKILTLAKFLGMRMEYSAAGTLEFETTDETKTLKYLKKELKKKHTEYHEDGGGVCDKEYCNRRPLKNFVLIVDECSMVDDKSFYLLNGEKMTKTKIKIIYVGDSYQLPPCGDFKKKATLSKVFQTKMPTYEMTTIMRTSDSEMMNLYQILRHCVDTCEEPFKFLKGIDDRKSDKIIIVSKNRFNAEVKKSKKKSNSKIISYSNKSVNGYNKLVKNKKKNDAEYMEGDKKMFSEFCKTPLHKFNTGKQMIVKEVEKHTMNSEYFNCEFRGYKIKFIDDEKNEFTLFKVSSDDKKKFDKRVNEKKKEILKTIKKTVGDDPDDHDLEDLEDPRTAKKKVQSKLLASEDLTILWGEFYMNKNSIDAPIVDAYAITSHKSQGSTYEEVYVDALDISICLRNDMPMKMRALYTAVSRASHKIIVCCNTSNVKSETPLKKCSSCHNNKPLESFMSQKERTKGEQRKCCKDCRLKKKKTKI